MKYKIKCCIGNKEKTEFAETIKDAEKKFDKFLNSKSKGEKTVFLLENTFEERYKVVKQQVVLNPKV